MLPNYIDKSKPSCLDTDNFEALDPSETVLYAWKLSSDKPKQVNQAGLI